MQANVSWNVKQKEVRTKNMEVSKSEFIKIENNNNSNNKLMKKEKKKPQSTDQYLPQ